MPSYFYDANKPWTHIAQLILEKQIAESLYCIKENCRIVSAVAEMKIGRLHVMLQELFSKLIKDYETGEFVSHKSHKCKP